MSKRRGSRHNPNPPPWYKPPPVTLDEGYQREVTRSTEKSEREYRRAQIRVQQAQTRLNRARQQTKTQTKRHLIAELQATLELRRAELEEIRRLMVAVPASAQHRGTKSFRPMPPL